MSTRNTRQRRQTAKQKAEAEAKAKAAAAEQAAAEQPEDELPEQDAADVAGDAVAQPKTAEATEGAEQPEGEQADEEATADAEQPESSEEEAKQDEEPEEVPDILTSNSSLMAATIALADGAPPAKQESVWGMTQDILEANDGKATGQEILEAFSGWERPHGARANAGFVLSHIRHRIRKGHLVQHNPSRETETAES